MNIGRCFWCLAICFDNEHSNNNNIMMIGTIYQSSKAFNMNNIEHLIEYQFIWAIIKQSITIVTIMQHVWINRWRQTVHSRTYVDRRTILLVFFAVILFTSIFPSDGRPIWYNSQIIELLILKLNNRLLWRPWVHGEWRKIVRRSTCVRECTVRLHLINWVNVTD